jgi:hypothetical protein
MKLKFYFKCVDLRMFPKLIGPSLDVVLELWPNNNHNGLKVLLF